MQPAALLLILASAAIHAGWNTLLKRHASPHQATIGVSLWCGISAIAWGLATAHHPFPTRASLWWSLGAGLCETCYFYTLGLALEKAPLSTVYTLARGGAVLFVWPLALVVSHEAVHPLELAGAAMVGAGLFLAGYRSGPVESRLGMAAALASAVFIAFNHVAYKQAIAAGGEQSMVFAASMLVATTLGLCRVGRGQLRTLAAAGLFTSRRVVAVGSLATLSFLLALAAMRTTGPGAVLTLRNLSIPFAVLLAWRGGERPTRPQLTGSLAVTVGALLVSGS